MSMHIWKQRSTMPMHTKSCSPASLAEPLLDAGEGALQEAQGQFALV